MIPTLIHLDRYRNEGTRVYSPHAAYTEARERYRPTSPYASFDLPTFRLPREALHVFEANPPGEIRELYLPDGDALFCIHPQLLDEEPDEDYVRLTRELGTPSPPIPVVPSSSTRTLYVMRKEGIRTPDAGSRGDSLERSGEGPLPHRSPSSLAPTCPWHALKVHFPFRISRYGRRMREEVVEQAVNVSRELEEGAHRLGHDFAFLREVLGVCHKDLDPESPRGENWGYVVRDMIPHPLLTGEVRLLPGFALYGGDLYDPAQPPLILELMGDDHPVDFLLVKVLLPILRHWVRCFTLHGFMLEPHGQNTLLELDGSGGIRRVVHRDLSPGIDMRRRRSEGLDSSGLNEYNRMEDGRFASIAYDKMMGGHFFEQLILTVLEAFPTVNAEDLREPCREEFGLLFPDHAEYLPRTVHYFSEQRDEFGKPLFEDTGKNPAWRP